MGSAESIVGCGDVLADDESTYVCKLPSNHRSAHEDGRRAVWTDADHWGGHERDGRELGYWDVRDPSGEDTPMGEGPWTKGPWEAGRFTEDEDHVTLVVDGPADEVNGLYIGPQICERVRSEADARLIAAAPEMAELLMRLVRLGKEDPSVETEAQDLLSRIHGEDTTG